MDNRNKGTSYEKEARSYLEGKGFYFLEANYLRKTGEIDLIMRDRDTLVFIEVKYRTGIRRGYPAEAVTPAKMRRIRRTAEWYLSEHRLYDVPCRFDVVSILNGEILHIENAFGGI